MRCAFVGGMWLCALSLVACGGDGGDAARAPAMAAEPSDAGGPAPASADPEPAPDAAAQPVRSRLGPLHVQTTHGPVAAIALPIAGEG